MREIGAIYIPTGHWCEVRSSLSLPHLDVHTAPAQEASGLRALHQCFQNKFLDILDVLSLYFPCQMAVGFSNTVREDRRVDFDRPNDSHDGDFEYLAVHSDMRGD